MATPPFLPDETKPADGDIMSQYPAVERLFRDVIETWLLVDHDTAGEHAKVTLPERGSDPSAVANTGFLYTKDDSADTELFYRDDSGNVVQLTLDGAPGAAFPATTSMLFYQNAAPTGWTKDTASPLNNHALRVVTSTAWSGGSTGGTSFTSVFGSSKSTTAANVTLPAHTHTMFANEDVTEGATHDLISSAQVAAEAAQGGLFEGYALRKTATGATVGKSGSTGSGTGSHSHTLSLDLFYISLIRATKD